MSRGIFVSLLVCVVMLVFMSSFSDCRASSSFSKQKPGALEVLEDVLSESTDSLGRTIRVVEFKLPTQGHHNQYLPPHLAMQLRVHITRALLDLGFHAVPISIWEHGQSLSLLTYHHSAQGAAETDVLLALRMLCYEALLMNRPRLLPNNPDARVSAQTPDYGAEYPQFEHNGHVWVVSDERPNDHSMGSFQSDGKGNIIRGTWQMRQQEFAWFALA